MRRLDHYRAAFLAVSVSFTASAHAADLVKVTGGTLAGTLGADPSVRLFKGVPYAAPPLGRLRWKAPQPVLAWTGTGKADTWGTRCMQGVMFGQPLVTRDAPLGEDCLYLNVWTTHLSFNVKSRRADRRS